VFDGKKKGAYKESDAPDPQNVYGHSKYAGELIVQSLLGDYLIVRPCWMFGGGQKRDKKFVAKIIAQLDKPEIKAASDAYGSPTFGKDLAAGIKTLIERRERGMVHMAGAGKASRFDVARLIVETLNPSITVTAVTSDYFKLSAVRVQNEELASRLPLMRPWQEALTEYLETEWEPALSTPKKNSGS
jgi:dTDP-4-dehydrorhamnose reductase